MYYNILWHTFFYQNSNTVYTLTENLQSPDIHLQYSSVLVRGVNKEEVVEVGGHNKVAFEANHNFIGKMGGWELGMGVWGVFKLWVKNTAFSAIKWFFFFAFFLVFCVYRCKGVFFHSEKSNVAKHSISYCVPL